MPVQVIIKRNFHIDDPKELILLLTKLRNHAKVQPGYISAQTLKNIDNPGESWSSAHGRRPMIGRNGCRVKNAETSRVKWIR